MKRKVNRVGTNTLTISIPSKWAKSRGIKPGDELDISEKGATLTVSAGAQKRDPLTRAPVKKFGFFHQNMLSCAYHLGYKEIRAEFKGERDFLKLQKRLNNYTGYEIVEQDENSCLVRDLGKPQQMEFDQVLRRTFILMLDMSERILDALSKEEYARLNEIRLLEAMNNKFTDYCRRIMNTIGHERQDRQTIIYTLLADLERIADEYKRICDFFHAERKPASKEVLAIFKEINKYARTYYELFYKYDPVKLKYMTDGGKDIVPRLESFVQSSNRHDAMLAHHLIYITIGLYDLSYTYIELNM